MTLRFPSSFVALTTVSLLWGCADHESTSDKSPLSASTTSPTVIQPSTPWQDAITATRENTSENATENTSENATENASQPTQTAVDTAMETLEAEPVRDSATLVGRWEPQSYLPSQGQAMDLTTLPPAQQADLVWVLTSEGTIRIGELEGTYTVEGQTIYARNPDSGDVTEFQFQLSQNQLAVERKGEIEKGVLLLVRDR